MNERIKILRKELGLTQIEFGKKLGVTRSVITNIEFNKTTPKPLFIDLLCREFNVNEEWIRYGKGDMYKKLSRSEKIANFAGSIMRDEEESFRRRLIEALSELDEKEWEFLENLTNKIVKKG